MIDRNVTNKIKLFVHNDADGVANIPLLYTCGGILSVDFEICSCTEVNQKVNEFLDSLFNAKYNSYEYIFIVDLSVSRDLAERINKINLQFNMPFIRLFDHHSNLEWLNCYSWATVEPISPQKNKNCGTSLFFEYLIENAYFDNKQTLVNYIRSFIELIRIYDTWDWKKNKSIHENIRNKAKDLNDCFKMVGPVNFMNKIYHMFLTYGKDPIGPQVFEIPNDWKNILKYKKIEMYEYIQKAKEKICFFQDDFMKLVNKKGIFVVCDRVDCTSMLGDTILEENKDISVVAMFYPFGIALRSRNENEFNCSLFAKKYGGGGHPESAGFKINDTILGEIRNKIFGNGEIEDD